jgi:hypothetical protein
MPNSDGIVKMRSAPPSLPKRSVHTQQDTAVVTFHSVITCFLAKPMACRFYSVFLTSLYVNFIAHLSEELGCRFYLRLHNRRRFMIVSLGMYVIHARTTLLLSVSDMILIINQPRLIHT